MKIYLLRHEKRFSSRYFDTDLTPEGKQDADKLVTTLEELNLEYIFISPYKRVVQTIEPYLLKNNLMVNPEYGIYESLHLDDTNVNIRDIDDKLFGYQYMNSKYVSSVSKDSLQIGESYSDIKNRSNVFLKSLLNNKELDGKNILLVCHLSVINAILNRNEHADFDMGKIVLFYDNGYLTNNI